MKRIIFLLSLLFSQAQASEWKNISSTEAVEVQIDEQSIALSKNSLRKAWAEYIYTNGQTRGVLGKKYFRMLELSLFNCSERTVGISQQVFYENRGGGAVVDSAVTPLSAVNMNDVVPGTIGESQLDFVCTVRLKKK